MKACPCCPNVDAPRGYEFRDTPGYERGADIFDEALHLDLGYPEAIKYLDTDMENEPDFVSQLSSNYGCSSAFKILSEKGMEILSRAVEDMHQFVVRTPRYEAVRGACFRNRFLHGLGHSPSILRLATSLAGCELIYHPMKIHQLHINYKPQNENDDGDDSGGDNGSAKRNVDRWHCDTTHYVLVLFATSPDQYQGGTLQYYNGTRKEGTSYFKADRPLPPEKVLDVGRQERGYGVFMQGSRVYHQVTPVLKGNERTTLVFSFQPRNALALEPLTNLAQTYNERDPLSILGTEWVRFHAWKSLRRLEMMKEHLRCASEELSEIVNACRGSMEKILTDLPYMWDREVLVSKLGKAVGGIKTWLLWYEGGNIPKAEGPDPSSKSKKQCVSVFAPSIAQQFVQSPFGLNNLRGLVKDAETCAEDISTIIEGGGSMEYFK